MAKLTFLLCLVLATSTITVHAEHLVKTWGDVETFFGFSNVTGQWVWNNVTDTNNTLAAKFPSYIPALPAVGGAQPPELYSMLGVIWILYSSSIVDL